MRAIIAVLLAPAVPPVIYFVLMAFVSGYTQQGSAHMGKLLQLSLGLTQISYLSSLALGAASILLLQKLGKLMARHVLGVALIAGALAGVGFCFFIYHYDLLEVAKVAWAFAALGAVAGLLVAGTFLILIGPLQRNAA
jgi:hypothetical protein